MKKNNHRSKLQVAEGVFVLGSVFGAIASIATNQVAYVSAPIAVALSLNILNRSKQLKETERHLQVEVTQVQRLTSSGIASFQQDLAPIKEREAKLQKDIQAKLASIDARINSLDIPESVDLAPLKEYSTKLQRDIQVNSDKLASIDARIDSLGIPEPVDLAPLTKSVQLTLSALAQLKEEINTKLDSTHLDNLESTIASLQGYISNSLQRDVAPFVESIQRLQSSVTQLGQNINTKADSTHVDELAAALASLQRHVDESLEKQNLAPLATGLNGTLETIERIKNDFKGLQHQFNSQQRKGEEMQQSITDLDDAVNSIRIDNRNLNDIINKTFARLDTFSAFDETDLDSKLDEFNKHIHQQFEELDVRFDSINELLENINGYDYKLVFGRLESRQQLIRALNSAEKDLIIVCPWTSKSGFDKEIIRLFHACLQRHVKIEVGWGKLSEIHSKVINVKDIANSNFEGFNNNFPALMKLANDYPQQISLKLLGTHEKYIVCDNSFAMLGSHNFLTSGASGEEREVGLVTDDPRIIKELIEKFQSAPNREVKA